MDGGEASLRDQLDLVPWNRLAHAYGFAHDARSTLLTLLDSTDSEQIDDAIEWVWSSILHQGSVYSASLPAIDWMLSVLAEQPDHQLALHIASFLDVLDEALGRMPVDIEQTQPVDVGRSPIYEAFIDTPGTTADDDFDGWKQAGTVRLSQLEQVVLRGLETLRHHVRSGTAGKRNAALGALCRIAGASAHELDGETAQLIESAIGDERFDPGVWISAVLASPRPALTFLEHSDRRIRFAGALRQDSQGIPSARVELVTAIADASWIDANFPNGSPTVFGWPRWEALSELLRRTNPTDATAEEVEAICRFLSDTSKAMTVDRDWGPAVQWAFQDRSIRLPVRDDELAPLPTQLTRAQRAILETVVAMDDLWRPRFGNASLNFRRVQLPYDRERIKQLLSRAEGVAAGGN